MADTGQASLASGGAVDPIAVGRFLDTIFTDGPVPVRLEQFPRGHSNLTFRVQRGDAELVLRRPPNGIIAKSAHDMAREHRVLSRLWRAYPAAPRSIALCDDPMVIGAPFFVMEHKTGTVFGELAPGDAVPDRATIRDRCIALVDALADLHAVDYRAIGLEDLGRPVGFIRRQVDGWRDRYARARTHDHASMDRLGTWLDANTPGDAAPTILHNDFKFDNLLFDDAKVSAVLDWEMCTIGDRFMDLGLLLTYWAMPDDGAGWRSKTDPSAWDGAPTRREVIDRYAMRSGQSLPNLDFYVAFGAFKLAVILQQLFARWAQGHSTDARSVAFPESVDELGHSGLRAAAGDAL